MHKRKYNGLRIASVYAAVILGAGFASGQELLQYFVGYGPSGVWGLMIAGVVFAITGWAVLDICHKEKITSFSGFMQHLLGSQLGPLTEWLVAAFLCVLFATMLAAAGATFRQGFNLSFTLGASAVGLVCFIVLLFDLEGIVRIHLVLTPFMVIGGIFLGLFTYFNQTVATFGGGQIVTGWVVASLVYASYNLVTGIPIMVASSRLAEKKRDCAVGGLLGGAVMTLLGLCMALPLYLYYRDVVAVEIPFLMIMMRYGSFFTVLYLIVMLCAVFTTAVTNAFAFIDWLCGHFDIGRRKACAILCVLGVVSAHAGFANFVGYVYPLFGFLGFFQVLVILIRRFFPSPSRKA